MRRILSALMLYCLAACQETRVEQPHNCQTEFIVLGIGQDAGAPQIGQNQDPAWADPSQRLWASSAALVNRETDQRYLFEATPDIREQLHLLDNLAPSNNGPLGLSGVFLTHAHIGHYAGLMFFGHESAGAKNLPVYAMPRMADYLRQNGPWEQMVKFENISLMALNADTSLNLSKHLTVTPYRVPHRDEYSETVGFEIKGPNKSVLFLPDINDWESWPETYGHTIQDRVNAVDYAFIDATFYDDHELPGRDMSQIPHPRVTESMDLFDDMPEATRAKIRFIHMNHTNPLRDETSAAMNELKKRGYRIARRGERYCL